MLTYFAVIALANLCLGYLLGTAFPMRRDCHASILEDVLPDLDGHDTLSSTATMLKPTKSVESSLPQPATDDGGAKRTTKESDRPDTIRKDAWTVPTSWDDFAQHLRTLKERIHYARSANDKQLAREVASQLESCAQVWSSQLQQCLDGDTTPALSALLASSGATHLEMCLAQIETTLTNIAQLDWSQDTDWVLHELEREVESLEKSQRRASAAR